MTVADSPIGVFDSGLGGLSVVESLRNILPSDDIVYFADSAFCPYGNRDPQTILERSFHAVRQLISRDCKAIIVACNTASAVALLDLRAHFSLPIVGLEPAVKPAVSLTRNKRIMVLATARTVRSDRLKRLIDLHANGVVVETIPAPGLVELVERGATPGSAAEAELERLIRPSLDRGCDVIVLGCTHYPFLGDEIKNVAGPDIAVIDSGSAVARRTRDLLRETGIARELSGRSGDFLLITSGDAAIVSDTASRITLSRIRAKAEVPASVNFGVSAAVALDQ
jgi:glutamate racemase